MNDGTRTEPDRRLIGIVEIDDSEESVAELERVVPSYVILQNHQPAPRGFRWIDVIHSGEATGRTWMADAADVLAVLEMSSPKLATYRVVRRSTGV